VFFPVVVPARHLEPTRPTKKKSTN
jgi:hypothetical protein